ncbi:hypothetical protein K438DRAFT_1991600 [Mycena galopus ATCC 62051]|nr:hypothetical protein K438DRAFT_1991600 [Mycena galopus ATCC 62051]
MLDDYGKVPGTKEYSHRAILDPAIAAVASACAAAAYIIFLTPKMLMAPTLPTPAETQGVLLEIKKRMPVGVLYVLSPPILFHTLSFIQSFLPHLRALITPSPQLCADAEEPPDRRKLVNSTSNAETETPKDAASSKSKPTPKPKKKLPWRRPQRKLIEVRPDLDLLHIFSVSCCISTATLAFTALIIDACTLRCIHLSSLL